MNKHFAPLFLVLFATQLSAQWQRAPWPGFDLSLEYLRNITCFKQVGDKLFACAENGLFVSPDFGTTWNRVESLPPTLVPRQLQLTEKGIYLLGDNTAAGVQFAGYVNTDKQGLVWQPAVPLPVCSSFVRIGSRYYAIFLSGSGLNLMDYSTDNGQSWQAFAPLGPNATVGRFTWHRDTLYLNFTNDRRVYRSVDEGKTFQLFSNIAMRGFQKTDGLLAGQLMNGFAPTDTLVYSLNEGASWIKYKLGFLNGQTLLIRKIDGRLYLQANSSTTLYTFDFAKQKIVGTFSPAAPYNIDLDQNYEFGGVQGNCYAGLANDTIFKTCNGVRTELTFPGKGAGLRELYSWRDSLFLLEAQGSALPRAYMTTDLDAPPKFLAPVGRLATYKPTGYTYYNDTVYSVYNNFWNYIAKVNAKTQQTVVEQRFGEGVNIDETLRTSTHLLARSYDVVHYRPLNGTDWDTLGVMNLELAANADDAYFFRYDQATKAPQLHRLGPQGTQEILPIAGFDYQADFNPGWVVLSAHDSVVLVLRQDNYRPRTLFYSTNRGLSFNSVDARQISDDAPISFRYLDGKIFVRRTSTGIYAYEPATDTWSPYNTGLSQAPVSLAALNHELVVGTGGAGLFRRPVQATYNARGRVYLDENNNAQWDAGEPPVVKIGVKADFAGSVVYTSDAGEFISATDVPADRHRVLLPRPDMKTVPADIATNNANANADFALQIPNSRDLGAQLFTPGVFRPGFDTDVFLRVRNMLRPAGNVKLVLAIPASKLTFVGANPAPALVNATGDTLVWNLGNMSYFADSTLKIKLRTAVAAPLGSFVQVEARVSANEADISPQNNRASLLAPIVGSFDPNDKLVHKAALQIQSPPAAERLAYTLCFQNTGTFPTSFVTLYDTLDTQVFDPTSIEWLGSSHPFEARLLRGNVLKIRFDPLHLEPQSVSETASQGYVAFSIATRQPLAAPAKIRNRVGIYFDFNQPVITRWAETVVDFTIPTEEPQAFETLEIYPNPAMESITLPDNKTKHEVLDVTIYETSGRVLLRQTLLPNARTLHIAHLPPGVLWVRVASTSGVAVGRIVHH